MSWLGLDLVVPPAPDAQFGAHSDSRGTTDQLRILAGKVNAAKVEEILGYEFQGISIL